MLVCADGNKVGPFMAQSSTPISAPPRTSANSADDGTSPHQPWGFRGGSRQKAQSSTNPEDTSKPEDLRSNRSQRVPRIQWIRRQNHPSGVDNVDATMLAGVHVHDRDYATRCGTEAQLAQAVAYAAKYNKCRNV